MGALTKMPIYIGDGLQQLQLIPNGDGWDVRCPACGKMDHQPYRVSNGEGKPIDLVASGAILTSWTCPNPDCGTSIVNQQLVSTE
jgi:hypothetical protein